MNMIPVVVEQQNNVDEVLASVVDELDAMHQGKKIPPGLRDVLRYIHEHLFEETLDVTTVCRHCGQNNHNVSSRFKRHIGIGMRDYIEYGRMEAAKRLLRYPDLSILQIAWSIGFTYPESFARAFKRYTGHTASAYRRILLRRKDKTARNGRLPEKS
ncbi:MAG: hypothetical protein KatS3mg042_0566 [Rhodothermaceae bacterium]|nr:MAG: hypothetical protein KatS3mg042_0566 [Rhodothermaceae bacterium]